MVGDQWWWWRRRRGLTPCMQSYVNGLWDSEFIPLNVFDIWAECWGFEFSALLYQDTNNIWTICFISFLIKIILFFSSFAGKYLDVLYTSAVWWERILFANEGNVARKSYAWRDNFANENIWIVLHWNFFVKLKRLKWKFLWFFYEFCRCRSRDPPIKFPWQSQLKDN